MMLDEITAELEEDLLWRQTELRSLRNTLLGGLSEGDWPISAMRTIMVMQYAHLEGFVRNAVALYVRTINDREVQASEFQPQIFAAALAAEFRAFRTGSQVPGGEELGADDEAGVFAKRARRQVDFVEKVRELERSVLIVDADEAISLEMNLGSDILRRTLYSLGIPESMVNKAQYTALEFVRRTRNDIAHGSRFELLEPRKFDATRRRCEEFMNDLRRLVVRALSEEWFLLEGARGSS